MSRKQADLVLERNWRRHLEQRRASGLTIRDYCRKHGLAEASYKYWRRTIADRDRLRVEPKTPAFVPVTISAPSASTSTSASVSAIDIRLKTGTTIRVRTDCDRQLLADVLTVLEGRSC